MKEKHFRTFIANFVIAIVIVASMSIAVIATLPNSNTTKYTNVEPIYSGNENNKNVCLMFNVYENTENVLKIAQIFKDYNFNTTFFIGGSWASHNGNALIQLATSGFEIGNHGYMHRDHKKLTYQQNLDEIRMTEALINANLKDLCLEGSESEMSACSSVSNLFAPPSGSIGENMFKACDTLDYKVIMWTRDTIDWRDHNVNIIYERAIRDIKAGDLILMHPTDCSVQALPRILDYIMEQNLTANTVSEVIS